MIIELTDDQIEIIGQALANHLEDTHDHAKTTQSERMKESYDKYAKAIQEALLAFHLQVNRAQV